MQKITLTYRDITVSPGPHVYSRDFFIYGYVPSVILHGKVIHAGINGTLAEYNVGARYAWKVDFLPIDPDSTDIQFLQQFCMYDQQLENNGSTGRYPRTISFYDTGSAVTYNVGLTSKDLAFQFDQNTFFAGMGSLEFMTSSMIRFDDDGTTWTLTPVYTLKSSITGGTFTSNSITGFPSNQWSNAATLGTYAANLVDVQALELAKTDFTFLGGNFRDIPYGTRQLFTVDLSALGDAPFPSPLQTWIIQYCLRQVKNLDTSNVALSTGSPYTVVHEEKQLTWNLDGSIESQLSIRLNFRDSALTYMPHTQ